MFLPLVKPPPPVITTTQSESLEIEWQTFCTELLLSVGTCDVQNRIEAEQVWLEVSFL